uniref:Tight junction protein ZO-2 n=1 Tax=Romanomermis culicivorax TaxID=13658 RepID=A0A915KE88_ROMCU
MNEVRTSNNICGYKDTERKDPMDFTNSCIYEERSSTWEFKNVHLNRVAGYGFGIAVSGGRDNPHFKSGEPSIVVSDVLQGGPAADLLTINDRIITANGINLENADYTTAIQIMKDSDQLNLIIRRRVPLPVVEYEQKTLKFTLTKTKKKDDFGVVLGCKFYIKSITNKKLAEKEPGLREGDAVVKINDVSCDDLTMTEARKLLDKSRERLSMVIKRDVPRGTAWKWSSQATLYEKLGNETPGQSPTPRQSPMVSCRLNDDSSIDAEAVYGVSGQIRSRYSRYCSNSQPVSRSRTPSQNFHDQSESYGSFQPRNNGVQVSTNNDLYSNNKPPLASPLPEPRFVSFCKEGGSVGVRVIGGNEVGIFVSAVQVNSPAAIKGVRTSDKILRANDRDMRHVTREEAVLHLLSLVDQVDLVLQYKREEFDMIRSQNLGDNFFIRVHFDYDHDSNKEKNGLCFKKGDVFQIVDTLYAGTVGWWQAIKIAAVSEKSNDEPSIKGVIPNLSRAEQIMANEKARVSRVNGTTVNGNSSGTGSLLRKKMTLTKRSKSLSKSGSSESVFPQIAVNFPAYERVQLKHPGFLRPVILYGPLADIAAEKLLQDFALRFASPKSLGYYQDNSNNAPDANGVKLSTIKEIMNKNKHCLLDVSPSSIEKLQYAQFCPIVIFLYVDNRSRLRELRRKAVNSKNNLASKSTKKLMEDANKLQKYSRHLFTAVLDATNRFDWFDALRELISHLQDRRVWMSETRPTDLVDDDFLFSLESDSQKKLMDSDGEEQSDNYGTLTTRRTPNIQLQAKTNGNSDNYSNINDSEISSSISQPVSSEGDSNLRQESSKNSTPDIPSDANDTTKIAASEACNSSKTLILRTTKIDSTINCFSSDRMSSSSYGSSAMPNNSLKQQPTNGNSPIINQLTNEMNEAFQSTTGNVIFN